MLNECFDDFFLPLCNMYVSVFYVIAERCCYLKCTTHDTKIYFPMIFSIKENDNIICPTFSVIQNVIISLGRFKQSAMLLKQRLQRCRQNHSSLYRPSSDCSVEYNLDQHCLLGLSDRSTGLGPQSCKIRLLV